MANVRMIFHGTKISETNETELELFSTVNNEVFISITDNYEQSICLDKKTAVRLVRELKKQIGFINQNLS